MNQTGNIAGRFSAMSEARRVIFAFAARAQLAPMYHQKKSFT